MGQRRKGSRVPSVALRNKATADENIRIKIAYFQNLISEATSEGEKGAESLAALPTSIRQFNNWELVNAVNVPLGESFSFRRNAPQTLNAAPGSLATVRACVEAAKRLRGRSADDAGSQGGRVFRLATLTRNIQIEKQLRNIAERELIAARERIESLKVELKILKAQNESKSREFSEAISKANREIDLLRADSGRRSARITPIDRRG